MKGCAGQVSALAAAGALLFGGFALAQTSPKAPPKAEEPRPRTAPGKLVTLPKLDDRSIRELIAGLIAKFELESGYAAASGEALKLVPPQPPQRVSTVGVPLARTSPDRATQVLRFGFFRQAGQLPQLWAYGVSAAPGKPISPNPDLDRIDDAVKEILESRKQNESGILTAELETRVIKLSYVDADAAMIVLKAMGFNALLPPPPPPPAPGAAPAAPPTPPEQTPGGGGGDAPADPAAEARPEPAAVPSELKNEELPLIIKMPNPLPGQAGLVGGTGSVQRDQLGLSMVLGATSRLSPDTIASPSSQLMIMFNPANPEQFARVRRAISEHIDRPARQILVEGMVLEISRDGLEELGVQWNFTEGINALLLGSLSPGATPNTFNFSQDTTTAGARARDAARQYILRIQALVRQGKAEVLARPSVLTLDNRQATIRVGTDIPIATSKDASSTTESRVSFSFQYLPTGIQLNIRPRMDEGGREVSMLIDATVSSTVPNADLTVRSTTGQILASAPSIATRRVQTYARIPDNTPLIIGGLVSREDQDNYDKVPLLGDMPVFGALFRSQQFQRSKREVIIVLTPYVLPENRSNFARALPKDDAHFDSLNNDLFRDAYRLRAGDVFDTGYIRTNRRLLAYRELVERIGAVYPERVTSGPFARVLDGRIPGEQTLMLGMAYNTIRRNGIGGDIIPNRMIVYEDNRTPDQFDTLRIDTLLARYGDGRDYESFFRMNPGKSLAITLRERIAGKPGDVLSEPKAQVQVVDTPDRNTWKRVLWEMNQPDASDNRRYTILLHDDTDVERLSRAIMLKRLALVNGGEENFRIANFLVGRQISIPEVRRNQTHLIDADVARNFYISEHYYPAFESEFERAMADVERGLRSPELRDLIREDEVPPSLRLGAVPIQ